MTAHVGSLNDDRGVDTLRYLNFDSGLINLPSKKKIAEILMALNCISKMLHKLIGSRVECKPFDQSFGVQISSGKNVKSVVMALRC